MAVAYVSAALASATQPDLAKTEDWLKKAVAAHPKDAKAPRTYAGWLLRHNGAGPVQPFALAVATPHDDA